MVYSKTLRIENFLKNLPDSTGYLIAYSGGADSTALLHLMAKINNIRAIHINHGLQVEADTWQQHCINTCNKLKIDLIVEQAQLENDSEEACREARYHFFCQHLKNNETLLTAHHQQDQAETILSQMIRGTGINGITGIDQHLQFHNGHIARPLLRYSPESLKSYLNDHNISWIEDKSNDDNKYKRNYIRNDILPLLTDRFNNAIENISRTAENIKDSAELLNHMLDLNDKPLAISKLSSLPEHLQLSLFYHWLSQKEMPVPDKKALNQICHDFIHAQSDKQPKYSNKFYQIVRWKDAIYCLSHFQTIHPDKEFIWHSNKPFNLINNMGVIHYSGLENHEFTVKFNQVGEKIKTIKNQTKRVKKLFQENEIPHWQRHNTPFIYLNGKLISLGYEWATDHPFQKMFQFNLRDIVI